MLTPMITQIGTGTDLQGEDDTKAARRALSAALRRNSLTVATALGLKREAMDVTILIGAARPERIDTEAVAADLPYGTRRVQAQAGGLDVMKPDGSRFVLANCAVLVSLDIPDRAQATPPAPPPPIGGRVGEGGLANPDLPPELNRIILETGTGADLHGMDYTKAAKRAVEDAIRHSSLSLFGALKLDPKRMRIDLFIAAQEPEAVDLPEVARALPYGTVHPTALFGGLNCPDPATGKDCVIVNAGILVSYPFG